MEATRWNYLATGCTIFTIFLCCSSDDTRDFTASTVHHRLRDHTSNIDSYIQTLMACRMIPGLVVSVVHEEETLLNKGYGWANIEESRKMTTDTRLCIASCSKAFTAILLGKLMLKTKYV